jgi:hypothetical protein
LKILLRGAIGTEFQVRKVSLRAGRGWYLALSKKVNVQKFLDYIGPCPPELQRELGYKWKYPVFSEKEKQLM